jgi:NAD-dependent dihydropyrimidine dehydrogenase PreA subunit
MCLMVCPHAVFDIKKRYGLYCRDTCMECGACAVNCPAEALAEESGEGCTVAILNEMLGRGCICVSECC